ncbi:MAG: hypothetical protein J7J67_02185 [Thermoproteales archaeon]|nr:hypothetical protein [Thermoproteales archaeon]
MSEELEEVKALLLRLIERVDRLERMLGERQMVDEVEAVALALKLLKLGAGMVNISSSALKLARVDKLLRKGRIKDEITRAILEVIAVKGAQSISDLERELRRLRGKASRRIIAQRVARLEELGFVEVYRKGRKKMVKLKEDKE